MAGDPARWCRRCVRAHGRRGGRALHGVTTSRVRQPVTAVGVCAAVGRRPGCARVDALRSIPEPVERVEAVAAELLPLDHERRAEMEVYLALFTAANADPDLRTARDVAHASVRDGCRWMIAQLDNGHDLAPDTDRELEAARLHAVIDGLAADLVYESADADPEWAHRVLLHHLRSLRDAVRDPG